MREQLEFSPVQYILRWGRVKLAKVRLELIRKNLIETDAEARTPSWPTMIAFWFHREGEYLALQDAGHMLTHQRESAKRDIGEQDGTK